MRSYNKKKKNNIIIGSLLGVMLIMTVGYAAFNSVLNIKGTSGISSNWDVRITNVVSKNVVGKASNAKEPTFEALTASMEVNLEEPKDSIEYDITVTNQGTINAKLDKINLTDPNNPAIKFTTSGLTEGTKLKVGESAVLTIKVEYLDGISVDPNNMSSTLTVTLEYSQSNINNEGIAVPELSASEMLTKNIVTTGDGLYEDTTEAGRYVYRGANPNNYIYIKEKNGTKEQDVLYRIISVESDGTLKIMRNDNLGDRSFEAPYTRSADYCNGNNDHGCNVWGSSTTMLNEKLENVTVMPKSVGDSAYTLPTAESQMNMYLNTTYYNRLSDDSKAIIDNHIWNVGPLERSYNLENAINQASAYKWRGKIGLINPIDYLKSSTDAGCTSIYNGSVYNESYPCKTNNYLQRSNTYWTMAPAYTCASYCVWHVNSSGYLVGNSLSYQLGVHPVFYLISDIHLDGEGTSTNPYTIVSE